MLKLNYTQRRLLVAGAVSGFLFLCAIMAAGPVGEHFPVMGFIAGGVLLIVTFWFVFSVIGE